MQVKTKYTPKVYTQSQLELLDEQDIQYPYSDEYAIYLPEYHQYELTNAFFLKHGIQLATELEGNSPTKITDFLATLRLKTYSYIYSHNLSSPRQMNYKIAKRGNLDMSLGEYRQLFLQSVLLQGKYMLASGDLSLLSGVDFDTFQNMSNDVMRRQERDFNRQAIDMWRTLGLVYMARYRFMPQGNDW